MQRRYVALCAALLCAVPAACNDNSLSGTRATTTLIMAPTRQQIEANTGLRFPQSTSGYRSVRITDRELDIEAKIAVADAERFVTDSHLTAATAPRVIVHASPIWEQNPVGDVKAYLGSTDRAAVRVELVTPPAPATGVQIRVVVEPTHQSAAPSTTR
jgi:hypothetical protein